MQTLITNAVMATLDGRWLVAGDGPYGLIERGYLAIENGQIAALGPMDELPAMTAILVAEILDARGRLLTLALIDCRAYHSWRPSCW